MLSVPLPVIDKFVAAFVCLVIVSERKFKVHTGHTSDNRSGQGEMAGGKFDLKKITNNPTFQKFTAAAKQGINDPGALADKFQQGVATGQAKIGEIGSALSESRDVALAAVPVTPDTPTGAYEGGGEFKAVVTLRNAINTFRHFYSIAKFKLNLNVASTEMKEYNKDYTTVVGSAVGKKLDKIHSDHEVLVKKIRDESTNQGYKQDLETIVGATDLSTIGLYAAGTAGNGGIGTSEWSAENIIDILEAQVRAKQKLYKVAQAVDEYLQKFTDAVATSPGDIMEVSKLLSSVEIMANWFNEKSGDSIASLYEIFPWTMLGMRTFMNKGLQNLTCGAMSDNIVRTKLTGHYYTAVLQTKGAAGDAGANVRQVTSDNTPHYTRLEEHGFGLPANPFLPISPARAKFAHKYAKYAIEKVYVLKNIVSAFTYLGKKFGDTDLSTSGSFMSPNEIYKCLTEYLYISSLTMGWGDGNNTRYYGLKKGITTAGIYPTNDANEYAPPLRYLSARDGHTGHGSVAGTVGRRADHGGGFKIGPYYEGPLISAAGVDAGLGGPAARAQVLLQNSINPDHIGNGNMHATWPGDNGIRIKLQSVARMKYTFGCAMAGIENQEVEAEKSTCMSGWKSVFWEEDKIFVTIIKAMAAKVFAVTGLYNMLNFGDSIQSYALSPTRLILGGGTRGGDSYTYQTPEIYPDAVELYARLPLLAEFYRNIFCFEEPCGDDTLDVSDSSHLLISMVPEVGSLWSGFIQTIFDQPSNTNGMYTENVLKRLIHEINGVYQHYKRKAPKDVCTAVITDFVAEVNSRYGLMNRKEIETYTAEESGRRTMATFGTIREDPEDFDILNEDNMGTGVAPSDRYTKISHRLMDSDHTIDSGVYDALRVFRRRIDKRVHDIMFKGMNGRQSTDIGFESRDRNDIPDFGRLILSTKETLKNIDEPEQKFKLIGGMMTGMDVQTQTNTEAAVMFHETIAAPLALLTSITTMLSSYQRGVRAWNASGLFSYLAGVGLEPLGSKSGFLDSGESMWEAANFNDSYSRIIPFLNEHLKELGQPGGRGPGAPGDGWPGDAQTMCFNMIRGDQEVLPDDAPNLAVNNINELIEQYHGGMDNWDTLPQRGAAHTTDDPNWSPKRHVAYCLIRWELVFKHLINLVYGLSADLGSMCEVSYQNGKMVVNATKLQMMCEEVFGTVRKEFDKFRGVVDSDTITNYEDHTSIGSINWVQEHLIDNLFNDQDRKSGLKRANNIVTESLMLVSNRLPQSPRIHATYCDFSNDGGGAFTDGFPVGGVFSEMTHYNSRTMAHHIVGVAGAGNLPTTGANMRDASTGFVEDDNQAKTVQPWQNFGSPANLKGALTQNDTWEHLMRVPSANSGDRDLSTNFAGRYDYYLQNNAGGHTNPGFRGDNNIDGIYHRIAYNDNDTVAVPQNNISNADTGMGLMMKFNEVMAAYLSQFWDPTTVKMYSPLIEAPANGPMNQEVFKAKGWPDLAELVDATDRSDSARLLPLVRDDTGHPSNIPMYNDGGVSDNANAAWLNDMWKFTSSDHTIDDAGLRPFFMDIDIPQITNVGGGLSFAAKPLHMISILAKHAVGPVNAAYVLDVQNPEFSQLVLDGMAFQAAWTRRPINAAALMDLDAGVGAGGEAAILIQAANTAALVNRGKARYHGATGRVYTPTEIRNIEEALNDCYAANNRTLDQANGGAFLFPADLNAGGAARQNIGAWRAVRGAFAMAAQDVVTDTYSYAQADVLAQAVEGAMGLGLDANHLGLVEVTGGTTFAATANARGDADNAITNLAAAMVPGTVNAVAVDSRNVTINAATFRTSLHWHLFDMKNRIITYLSAVDTRQDRTTWKGSFTRWLGTLLTSTTDRWVEEERARIMELVNPCRTYIGNDGVSAITLYGTVDAALRASARFMAIVDAKLAQRRAEATALFGLYTGHVATVSGNQRLSIIEAVVAATIAIEPLTLPMCDEYVAGPTALGGRLHNDGDHEMRGHRGIGANWQTYSAISSMRKEHLYRSIALTGGRLGRVYDRLYSTSVLMDVRNHLIEAFRRSRPRYDQADFYNNRYSNVAIRGPARGAANIAIPLAAIQIPHNHFTGAVDWRTVPYLTSKLLGFGMAYVNTNPAHGMLPTPVDFLDWQSVNDGIGIGAVTRGGYGLIASGATGHPLGGPMTWDRIVGIALAVFKTGYETSSLSASLDTLTTEDIPIRGTGEADPIRILFASLGKALRTALTEVNKQGVKVNVTQSIAEVPIRSKEIMKAHLPVFWEMFQLISKRADLLKGCLKVGINCQRQAGPWMAIGGKDELPGVHGGTRGCCVMTKVEADRWYTGLLDQINSASDSMCVTIKGVLTELNDAPLYLETHENSIVEYKNTSSNLPFMPLSSMTTALRPSTKHLSVGVWGATLGADRREPNIGYPGTSSGDAFFQYQYGTRLVLHDYSSKPLIEHLPGMKDIMEKYNMVSQGGKEVDVKTFGQFVGKCVELLRYVTSTRLNAPLFGADRRIVDNSAIDIITLDAHSTYQLTIPMASVIELTTSSDKKVSIEAVVNHVMNAPAASDVSRYSSMIYNILDLNISPINVHAMRREIPLVNIYNYAYTFDTFVTQIAQSSYDGEGGNGFTLGNNTRTTHDVLSGLCKHPYIRIPRETFYGKLHALLGGNSTIDMQGYPKFITDQLWSKCLLQNTVVGSLSAFDGNQWTNAPNPRSDRVPSNLSRDPHGYSADWYNMRYRDENTRMVELVTNVGADSDQAGRQYIGEIGRLRFDTKFARNMFFLANVQRIMTHKIASELTKLTYPVASNAAVTNRKITDYKDGETFANLSID